MDFPNVKIGDLDAETVDWRAAGIEDTDDDDVTEADPDVIAMLGFDPFDDSDDTAFDATIALDRATIRSKDVDGRLHVDLTPISKAAVNPYYGREIPNCRALGLEPGRIYRLLRDPDEIEKAAGSFNKLPLLSRHKPTSAGDHPTDEVVGSTGEQATFDGAYLKNSLVVWRQDAIDAIESGEQRELSCGYRYDPDMTPGAWRGEHYDGVMRNIVGNHVALVREGRAGPDVVVGDSALEPGDSTMAKTPTPTLSPKATLARGALISLVLPKLAQDAKIPDFTPVLKDITAKNFTAKKPAIVEGVRRALEGKLATDATLEDVNGLLDKLEGVDAGDPPAEQAAPGDPVASAREFLKSKLSEDDFAEFEKRLSPAAKDADPAEPKDPVQPKKGDQEQPKAEDAEKEEEDKVSKAAMDAAIAEATKRATADTLRIQREVRAAEREVEPVVGQMQGAFDSAGDVYRAALDLKGVNTKAVKESAALKAMFDMLKTQATTPAPRKIAMDGAAADDFAKRFPNANRLKA